MKTTLFAILAFVSLVVTSAAAEPENPLEVWSREYLSGARDIHPPIALSATLKVRNGEHLLSFRLTNISKELILLYPSILPWGNPYAIGIVAFDTDGTRLRRTYPISDPQPEEKQPIRPGQTLEGDYRLSDVLALREMPKDRDVIVLWSYMVSKGGDDPVTLCTGAVVLPRAR